jgi:Putative zincin peptidase
MSLTLIDRFHPRLTREQQVKIDAGKLRKIDEIELLSPQQLQPLAQLSLVMLIVGLIIFAVLNLGVYAWQHHMLIGPLSFPGVVLWIVINILAYIVVLPLHEAVHGLAFLLWGGRPYFGTKLPFALYCGAKDQLFRRNHYLVVGLAPLVVLTLAAIVLTLLVPGLASYALFGTVGNFSGAAGDVWVAWRLRRQPPGTLIQDTQSGYIAWEITD